MTAKVKSNAPHRLIVEGRDDQWSILALTARHGWDWNNPAKHLPYIDNAEGIEKALEALAITVRTYARVGIVLDADLAVRGAQGQGQRGDRRQLRDHAAVRPGLSRSGEVRAGCRRR